MTDSRTPLVLLSGLHRRLAAQVGTALLDRPGTVVVHHDVSQLGQGAVLRTQRHRTGNAVAEQATAVELAHGCLSCTLRLDLLPLLRALARRNDVTRVVLHLDPALEPEHLCWSVANVLLDDETGGTPETAGDWVRVEGVLAVVEAASWLDDVTGGDDLADRGLAATLDDDRTLAQVALSQVAFADAVVLAGPPADAWAGARLDAVLDRLVPGVPRADVRVHPDRLLTAVPAGARRGRISTAHDPLLAGQPPLGEDCGVQLVRFSPDRPLHPGRLHEALDLLLDGVVCSRGRLWLASQHDRAVWLESAGQGLRVGDAGPWLATLDDAAWADVDPQRRVAAALRWDPVHGDRHTELVVLTHRQPALAITAALHAAALTDEEWTAGPDAWRRYPDPFGTWHEDPCEASSPTDDSSTHVTNREERS
ncbi:ribosome hibernation factor-recruiting GTPase MRF [Blastococcus mobilis]|uniref:GTPase, G3E family n=1 Tax=Blastococcus mobilis TaxID=1938746 RepID=A0A238ZJZ4_9ACTN|nr:GTP-binding protein [Blastococcus mobilis]SNR83502.1 GTPase, G3E family [Blastococcus mobilis]